jgi:hypothetical protein
MKRLAFVPVLILISTILSFPSDPGHGLTWEDVVLDQPNLEIEPFLISSDPSICSQPDYRFETVADLRCLRSSGIPIPVTDAEGSIYFITTTGPVPGQNGALWRTRKNGKTQRVAYTRTRHISAEAFEHGVFLALYPDQVHGFLYVTLLSACQPLGHADCEYQHKTEVFRIRGLKSLKKIQEGSKDTGPK